MTVGSSSRRLLAFLAASGFAAGILIYVGSFPRARVSDASLWWVAFVLGWMALFLPLYVIEYPASRTASFAWKGFARGMPSYVAPFSVLLSLIAVGHFLWFTAHSGWGVPEFQDGQYVSVARGRILRVLTEAEFFKLRAMDARMFATTMSYLYFTPMTYWWFHRDDRLTSS